jgi:tetratricopeptide (TPR) repeat protein
MQSVKLLLFAILCGGGLVSFSFAQDTIVEATIIGAEELEADKSYNLGIDQFQQNDFEGAIASFGKAIELKEGFTKAYLNRGSAYMEMEKYSEAIQDFNVALNDPEGKDAYYLRGKCYDALGSPDKARGDYESAMKANVSDDRPYYYRGLLKFDNGDYKGSILDFTEAIKRNKRHAYAYNDRGSAKRMMEKYDDAIKDYLKALQIDNQLAFVHNNLGSAYRKKGRYEEAIKAYSKAVEVDPKYHLAFNNRGSAHYDAGNYEKALADFDKAVALNKEYAFAYNNRATAKLKLED